MTRKPQVKFVAAIMAFLTLAFAACFAVSAYENRNLLVRESQFELDILEKRYEDDPLSSDFPQNFFVVEVYSPNAYTVKCGEENFSSQDIDSTVLKATDKNYDYGSYKKIFYKRIYDGATLKIYAVDMAGKADYLDGALMKILVVLLIAEAVLFLAVIGVSAKIFAPIKQTILKQRRFISDASHELKTPLAIISANAEVLDADSPYAQSIKKQVERMDFLVEDLLSLAKLDEGQRQIIKEEFCVSEEVSDVILTFDALSYEKGKRLTSDIAPDITYLGDKAGLKRITGILLDNAVKYSSEKGNILVTLKKSGQRIILTVKNDGSNVPDAMSERIFERFFRDDSRSREYGGNGLGLSIAKSIAEKNGWNISAESVFGVSMTVTLVL